MYSNVSLGLWVAVTHVRVNIVPDGGLSRLRFSATCLRVQPT